MKTVLIISNSLLESDPRILKQIEALKNDYKVITAGYSRSNVKKVYKEFDILQPKFKNAGLFKKLTSLVKLFFKLYYSYYWNSTNKQILSLLKTEQIDCIIANEINTLPIADKLAKHLDIPIYCDLHEYYFGLKGKAWFSKLHFGFDLWLLENHQDKIKRYSTVSKGIINLYKEEFGVDCQWIDNACKYYDLRPSVVSSGKISMVTHGASIRDRKLELMIDVVSLLDDRFTLDMYLMPKDKVYIEELKQKANKIAPHRIKIHGGIPFNEIQETINKYDIGIYILFPTNINNKLALPNKIFEFIQGRLAVAIGPSQEMEGIVEEYNIGIVADDFSPESLANKIIAMNEQTITKFKENTEKAAKDINAEKNMESILFLVQEMINE